MRFGRISTCRHPSACSACDFIRWGCPSEKSSLSSDYWVLIGLTALSGTGRTNSPSSKKTRRLRSRRGSPSTRNKSRSTVRKSGCLRRSTSTRSYCSKSTCTAAAGRPRGGVLAPTHPETRCRRHGVSRRQRRLSDCHVPTRIGRSTQLYRAEPHRKMVPDSLDAD